MSVRNWLPNAPSDKGGFSIFDRERKKSTKLERQYMEAAKSEQKEAMAIEPKMF